ncbi:MAG TPA: UDP-N-acetylmuramoyl-tripeptide--D-alanyl-D-alanine ligase [Mycobacteriales bacterium]
MKTTLGMAAAATGGVLHADAATTYVSVVIDSRAAEPGALFVALPGERVDGHDFAESACAAGAVAVVVERPVAVPHVLVPDAVRALAALATAHRDRLTAQVVGVTGSAGKTSTKDLLGAILAESGPTVAPPGSYNNDLGAPLTVLRADELTRHLVVEMGARAVGDVARLCAMARPTTAVVLNVGSAHLGEFGSREAIAVAKGELVDAATDLAVLNADDPLVAAMSSRARAEIRTFGMAGDVRAEGLQLDSHGRPSFRLVAPEGGTPVRMLLIGAHQVSNALAAATVGLAVGLSVEVVGAALNRARPASRWRMEVTETPEGVTVINDAYNANPESMRAALDALVAMDAVRHLAVLGPMAELGDGAEEAHAVVADYARSLGVHRLIAVAAPDYGADADVADVSAAAAMLSAELRRGDAVLVKASRAAGLERLAARLVRQDDPS